MGEQGRIRRMARAGGAVLAVLTAGAIAGACAPPPVPGASDPLLSRGNGGVIGDRPATQGSLSLSGSIVAFTSSATNIAPGATGNSDLFVRDRSANTTTRVAGSVFSVPRVSQNGRWVSYRDTGGTLGVYDRLTATTRTFNEGGASYLSVPAVPDDGSVAVYGSQDPFAVNPWSCTVRDLATAATTDCPALSAAGVSGLEGVSGNGRFVLYAWRDVTPSGTSGNYLWDRTTNTTVSVPAPMVEYFGGQVSDDGQRVTGFVSTGSSFTIGVWDRATDSVLTLPTVPNGTQTVGWSISPNGRRVAITSDADNLVTGDANGTFDVFVWDVSAATVARASHGAGGAELPGASLGCGAGPGQFVGNTATVCVVTDQGLTTADTNNAADLYTLAP